MSDEVNPAEAVSLPKRPARTLLPEGYELVIEGRKFRLEMRAVISGTSEDIAAIKLPELE